MRDAGDGTCVCIVPRYARTSEACNGSIVNATPVSARVKKTYVGVQQNGQNERTPDDIFMWERVLHAPKFNKSKFNCQIRATHRTGKSRPVFLMHERDDASGTLERQVKFTKATVL